MNIEIKKKLYSAPQMSIVEMRGQMNLLETSGDGGPGVEDGVYDYDGELGFIFKDSDRKA